MSMVLSIFLPYLAARVLAFASAAALFSAFVAQYHFHLPPCHLCYYERVPYGLILIAFVFLHSSRLRLFFSVAILLLSLSAGLAFYHFGVEQLWWEPTSTCKVNLEGTTLEELEHAVLNKPLTDCRQVTWSFLGASMAFWNILYSVFLMAYAVAIRQRMTT